MLQRLYISDQEYFALPYASNSGIKEAHKLLNAKDTPEVEYRADYYFGSAIDSILTNPENIDTTKMSKESHVTIMPMARAIQRNEIYKSLFSPASGVEHQAVFIDLEFPVTFDGLTTTVPAKCKFDWWNPKPYLNAGGDLKTTNCRDDAYFKKAAKFFDYDQQAAWYMDITGSERFIIIAISKVNQKVFTLSYKKGDEEYISGRDKYLRRVSSWWKLYGATAA